MNILLTHARIKKESNSDWIYLGNSYILLKRNLKRHLGKRIELNDWITKNNIKKIEKWLPTALETDHSNDIYLNRIYRLYFYHHIIGLLH